MGSRENILKKLHDAHKPFLDVSPIERISTVPDVDESQTGLIERFITEAQKVKVTVYPIQDEKQAIKQIIELVGTQKKVLSWDQSKIQLVGLHKALSGVGIQIAKPDDNTIPIGITGVDAGLAATGSLLLRSGKGQYRTVSLLPDKHIAIMRASQITRDFETWVQQQRETFASPSNITIITGPSKTADIAQELILGAHGPRSVHVILLKDT